FIHFIIISFLFTWSDWLAILVFSFLLIAPTYLSNASMVFFGGGKPIDGGKVWKDGRRIFGDHKTWNGLLKGPIYFGIPISIGIFLLFLILWQFIGPAYQLAIDADLYVLYNSLIYYQYYFIGGPFPIGLISLLIRIIICSYSTGIGDLIGSFFKRRKDIKSGMPFWIVDQLDFVIVVLIFISIPGLIAPGLFWVPDINIIIFVLILTPSITIIGSSVGYYLGIKDVPW
ncbi:MAG: CDP-archaeol synthase, partial [Promethearchaeota archaeon]